MIEPALPDPPPEPGPRGRVALAVAAAVDAVDGARRAPGRAVDVATQYPGGRVIGVRLGDDRIEIHIVAERTAVTAVADDVLDAVRRALDLVRDDRPVTVVVDDLDVVSLSGRVS